ncbi:hypothetical protein DSECCO2_586390 [anaerobic digester metagenome]
MRGRVCTAHFAVFIGNKSIVINIVGFGTALQNALEADACIGIDGQQKKSAFGTECVNLACGADTLDDGVLSVLHGLIVQLFNNIRCTMFCAQLIGHGHHAVAVFGHPAPAYFFQQKLPY